MQTIRLEGGPYCGAEGPINTRLMPSWIGVREGGDGPNGLLVSPGCSNGGEVYVLAVGGEVCVYRHSVVGADTPSVTISEYGVG